MARFDWYQASADIQPMAIVEAVLGEVEGAQGIEYGRGRNGYASAIKVMDSDGHTVAEVHSGGRNMPPNAFASGANANPFAEVLRRHWPALHRVTRVDSCEDLRASFVDVHAPLLDVARKAGLRARTITPLDPDEGATLYLGSPSSRVSARIYEKGKEMRAKGHEVTPEQLAMVRFEVQLRPKKEGRLTAAGLTAGQCWGASHWTRDVATKFLGQDPGRQHMQFKLASDFERSVKHMTIQYGPTLRELHRRCGTDWAFLTVLKGLIASDEASGDD